MSRSKKAYRVMTENGEYPYKDGYVHHRNIFYTRGEAELSKISVQSFNPGVQLIIEESELQWTQSGF